MRKEPQGFDSPLAHDDNLINRIMKEKEIPILDASGKVLFKCIEAGDNLTVGGSIDLRYTQITSLPDNIHNIPSMLIWGGKYVLVDEIFAEVINHRGNVWKTKRIGRKDIEYIVTDGNGKYAHGRTIKEAKGDLIYKISNRDKSRYEGMKLTDTLTHEEAIEAYRVITGACSAGTRDYVENYLGENKARTYTIEEIIQLTKGRFGNQTFADFFNSQHY